MRWKKILSGILVSAMALGAVVSGIPQKALGAENLAGGGTNEITESLLRVNQKGARQERLRLRKANQPARIMRMREII